jgi:2-octaprenyl-6-methoxyphenol hydroxylase
MPEFDVAIVGAGPVGATLAALAAGSGVSIAIFEARPAASNDPRTLALSHASRELLEEAGAWPAAHATSIASIHISQQGGPGRTLLRASEQRLPALGYTVPFAALESALGARIAAQAVEVHFGETCSGIELEPDAATLTFASGARRAAWCSPTADQRRSHPWHASPRRTTNSGWSARSRCIGRNEPRSRFTPRGPMALLPVGDRYAQDGNPKPSVARARRADFSPSCGALAIAPGALPRIRAPRFLSNCAR